MASCFDAPLVKSTAYPEEALKELGIRFFPEYRSQSLNFKFGGTKKTADLIMSREML